MSLRTRLVLLQAGVLIAGLGLLGAVLVGVMEAALLREVDGVLAARGATVAEDVRAAAARGVGAADAAGVRVDPEPLEEFAAPGIYVQIVGPDGRVLRSSQNLRGGSLPGLEAALADARQGRTRLETLPTPSGDRVRALAVPVEDGGRLLAVVRVGESLHQVDTVLRRLVWVLLAAGSLVLASAILATWLLVDRTLAPLARIAATAERIASTGDVTLRVSAPRGGEIGLLGRSFNRMVDRLRRLLDSQRQLLADTSHELRNPLTVIRTNLDLLKRDLDPATREEVAVETEAEAERMSRLVADLLLLAREDGQAAPRGELAPVHLDTLAREVVDRFRQLAPEHAVVLAEAEPLVIRGDPDRLRQLLANLLDNAARYTPPGGRIAVALRRDGSVARLTVEDTGVGIPPEHLPRIFDRFYRVDPGRGRATGGTGLGLAIVKHVAEAHRGRVEAESVVGSGSRFTVTLPAEPSWSTEVAGGEVGLADART